MIGRVLFAFSLIVVGLFWTISGLFNGDFHIAAAFVGPVIAALGVLILKQIKDTGKPIRSGLKGDGYLSLGDSSKEARELRRTHKNTLFEEQHVTVPSPDLVKNTAVSESNFFPPIIGAGFAIYYYYQAKEGGEDSWIYWTYTALGIGVVIYYVIRVGIGIVSYYLLRIYNGQKAHEKITDYKIRRPILSGDSDNEEEDDDQQL